MSENETTNGLQVVTARVDGWCDPVSGVCHFEPAVPSDPQPADQAEELEEKAS